MRLLINKVVAFGSISIAQKFIALVMVTQIISLVGEAEFGNYIYLLNLANLAAMIVVFGFPQLLTREIAYYRTLGHHGRVTGIMRFAFVFVALGMMIVMIPSSMACWFYCSPSAGFSNDAAWVAILLFGTITLTSLQQAILRGLNRIIIAAWPIMLLQPLIMLGLVVLSELLAWDTTALNVLGFMVVGNLAAAICMASFIKHTLSAKESQRQAKRSYEFAAWSRSLLPFFLLGGLALLMQRSDILILGLFRPPEDIGIYAISAQLAFLAQMPIIIVNSMIEPQIAVAHAHREYGKMRKLYADLSVVTGVSTVAVCAGLWLLGPWLLTSLFGPAYIASHTPLLIIALGFAVGAMIGPTGTFLSMVGKERMTLYAVSGSVVLNIALNFLLIPLSGLVGAAIATSTALIASKILMAIMIWRVLGIKPGPLGYVGVAHGATLSSSLESENTK